MTDPDPVDSIITVAPGPLQPTIPILAMAEGTCYLGVYVTHNGTTQPMENHIWQQAVTYTRAFQCTHVSCKEASILYRACFLPALTYSFPATWLSAKFLEQIHTLSTSTILNKMGFHCKLPRSMVFVPRDLGRVGLCNLIHKQSVQQLLILTRHLQAKTPLGTAMELLICTYQLWAELQCHVLDDTQPCPWIPDHWLSHLRAMMQSNKTKT